MKWVKRLLKVALVVLLAAVALGAYSMWKSRKNPEWYKPLAMSEQQIEILAHRAEAQLQRLNNMASRAHSNESAARQGATAPVKVPPEILRFSEDELNALFIKWFGSSLSEADQEKMGKYFTDLQVHFQDGQIIVAGVVKEVGRVISIHLRPSIDVRGRLLMEITAVYTGQLPIPEAALSSQIARLDVLIEQYLPAWQRTAAMDGDHGSNDATVKAAMSELALDSLHHRPGSSIFFLKTADKHIDPVKLTQVKVGDGFISLAVEPLTSEERRDALAEIKHPRTEAKTPRE